MLKRLIYPALTRLGDSFIGRFIFSKSFLLKRLYDKLDFLLFKQYWSGGYIVEVQGSKMYVDVFHPDFSMRQTFRHYALHRIHEAQTSALFCESISPGDVVVDIGANIGYFSLLAARLVGNTGKVYSFEPEPRNYAFLLRNIALNGYDRVTARQKAVADRRGTVKLFLCPYDTGHHTIRQFEGIRSYRPRAAGSKGDCVEVETVRLDDEFRGNLSPVNVIKMDVEGAEMLALAGMEDVIRANRNLVMFIEFFPLLINKMGQSPQEFLRRLLEDFSFRVFVIGKDYPMKDSHAQDARLRITSVGQLMGLCKGRNDHLNLYLRKG